MELGLFLFCFQSGEFRGDAGLLVVGGCAHSESGET